MSNKTFSKFRNEIDDELFKDILAEQKDEEESEVKVKSTPAGVESPVPTNKDELEGKDADKSDWQSVDAIKPVYVRDEHGGYTLADGNVGKTSGPVNEEIMIENILDNLKKIVTKHQSASVRLSDGTKLEIDVQTANAILQVLGALNKNNQSKFTNMLMQNSQGFSKVVKFAMDQLSRSDSSQPGRLTSMQ